MSKVIPLENKEERDEADAFWRALEDSTYFVRGWMADASGIQDVIDRVERAINAYDRKHDREAT